MWALIGSFTRIYPIDFSSPPATLGFPQAKKKRPPFFSPCPPFSIRPPLLIAGTFHRWFTALISERRKGGKRKKRPLSLLTFSPLAYDKVRKAPRCEEFCFFFLWRGKFVGKSSVVRASRNYRGGATAARKKNTTTQAREWALVSSQAKGKKEIIACYVVAFAITSLVRAKSTTKNELQTHEKWKKSALLLKNHLKF